MKQKKNMLLLLLLLAVLVGIYVIMNISNKNKEEQEAKEAEAATIHIIDDEEITALRYTDGESEISFVKEDDEWLYEDDKEIPIAEGVVGVIADAVTGLIAVRELNDPDELSDYGLTEPSYTIWYTAEEEIPIYIGNMAGENYYLTVGDTGRVYTITDTIVTSLTFDLAEFVENDTVPSIGSGNLKKVEVTGDGKKTEYTEEEDLGQLAGGFGVLTLDTCVDFHVTEQKLAGYGFDKENRITAVATYTNADTEEEETFTVYIGDDVDEENQYLMLEGSILVYQVSQDVVENMIVVSEEEVAEE